MDDIIIYPMEVKHLPEVLTIERKIFSSPWSEEVFLQELHGIQVSRAMVALQDDKVAGYALAWFIKEEIHLVNIAVDPDMRQRGIGSQLMSNLVETAIDEGKKLMTLEVRVSNTSAQALYRAFSFEYIGLRERYYSDNREDAVLMALDLEEYQLHRQKKRWSDPM